MAVVGLGACDGEEPSPTSSPTSESPTEEEPTSDEPSGPEVESPVPHDSIARDDVHGAEAAAEYFLQLYPYVYATGDLDEFESMSTDSCGFCQSVIDDATELHQSGGGQTGGGFSVVESNAGPAPESEGFLVQVIAEERQAVRTSADGETETFGGTRVRVGVVAQWSTDRWTITGVNAESVGDSET